MKIIKLEQAERYDNSDKCKVLEYGFNDKDIDCATATINGRYPDTGYCMNEKCKELIKYYWDAHCTIVMPCTPAWYPEQHKLIK